MYERHHTKPLSLRGFNKRMAFHGCVALAVIAASLFAGMLAPVVHRVLHRFHWAAGPGE